MNSLNLQTKKLPGKGLLIALQTHLCNSMPTYTLNNSVRSMTKPTLPSRFLPAVVAASIFCLPVLADETRQKENCQTVKQLLTDYKSRYENVRHSKRAYNNITIWQTPIQLIKNRCEIWEWSGGKIRYMCSLVLPNESSARVVYADAKEKVAQCLSAQWTLTEQPRKMAEGNKALFSNPDRKAIVSLHVIKSDALFKEEWNTYLFIGDREDQL